MDRFTDRQVGQIYSQTSQTTGQFDEQRDGYFDSWIVGQVDSWIDRQLNSGIF